MIAELRLRGEVSFRGSWQLRKDLLRRLIIQRQQPCGLRRRQAQSRHLEKLAANAVDQRHVAHERRLARQRPGRDTVIRMERPYGAPTRTALRGESSSASFRASAWVRNGKCPAAPIAALRSVRSAGEPSVATRVIRSASATTSFATA